MEVHFTGKSKGVKESGGVFNVIRRTVEVECLPAEIPDSFSIDISSLDINQNFHVSDLKIPEKIKLITSPKASLCMVSEVTEEATSSTEETEKGSGEAATPGAGEATKKENKKEDKSS